MSGPCKPEPPRRIEITTHNDKAPRFVTTHGGKLPRCAYCNNIQADSDVRCPSCGAPR